MKKDQIQQRNRKMGGSKSGRKATPMAAAAPSSAMANEQQQQLALLATAGTEAGDGGSVDMSKMVVEMSDSEFTNVSALGKRLANFDIGTNSQKMHPN
jgi:hypothetical protein